MKKTDKGEEYINAFPKLKKWINECLLCHRKGYDPSMPDKITTVEGSLEVLYLKKYFEPLILNKNGLCQDCERLLKNRKE